MIKRILCVIKGHNWLFFSGWSFPDIKWEHKECQRCGERNIDRIFEQS